jgi:ribosomal protein S18 acetylase RimI-like enzyme
MITIGALTESDREAWARALIEAVAAKAREAQATHLYWMTKEDNARARLLYDKLASFGGFIRYDYSL